MREENSESCDCPACKMREELGDDAFFAMRQLQMTTNVMMHGHTKVAVMGGPGTLPFAYTVGLGLKGRPDIVVVGVNDPEVAAGILQGAVQLDHPIELDREYDKVLVGYKVKFVEPSPDVIEEMGQSRRFHDGMRADDSQRWSAIQVLWPDQEGRFPGEDGCENTEQLSVATGCGCGPNGPTIQ